MLQQIATNFHPELMLQVAAGYKYVLMLMVFGYLTHFIPESWDNGIVRLLQRGGITVSALLIVIVAYMVIQVKSSEIQPFIYFQF